MTATMPGKGATDDQPAGETLAELCERWRGEVKEAEDSGEMRISNTIQLCLQELEYCLELEEDDEEKALERLWDAWDAGRRTQAGWITPRVDAMVTRVTSECGVTSDKVSAALPGMNSGVVVAAEREYGSPPSVNFRAEINSFNSSVLGSFSSATLIIGSAMRAEWERIKADATKNHHPRG